LVGAQLFEQAEAIEAGHHHVGEDEVGGPLAGTLQRGFAVRDGFNFIGFAEQPLNILPHIRIVIGEQDSRDV
jgi:hypothetical protein